jgi:lipopolysaccharide/colanic/teichoic acid biosynthesis glycosyltransferase
VLAKRLFDIICALVGLLILSPVFLVIILCIKLTSPGSIFFRQVRVGQYEIPFRIHKFRTMIVGAEAKGLKLTVGKDPRVTAVGQFLRKTKLDELPQLIDVLIGHMSLVGPRPEVPEYVRAYPVEVRRIVFRVKPGITDWASIKMIDENLILAKSENPQKDYIDNILPEKLGYAVKYVKTRSLLGDIGLIFLTIIRIFIR